MSIELSASGNERNDATTDNNNNSNGSNECVRPTDVVSASLTSPTSSDDPSTIFTRGPDYLRARIFQRQSGFDRHTPHKSAAESLLESRRLFVRQESDSNRVMSMMTQSLNVTADTMEELSSENGLVESMVSKLYIPKTESADLVSSHGSNPPTSLRQPTMGKRRLCTTTDDPYGSQKQRQKLGSAAISANRGRSSDISDNIRSCQWKSTEYGPISKEREELVSSETSLITEQERSEENSQGKAGYEPGVESMDVGSDGRPLSTVPEVHQCDGALCRGTIWEANIPDCKMDGDEMDASYRSSASPLPAVSEWRDYQGEMATDGGLRAEDGKGAKVFRRYRKVVGKSGIVATRNLDSFFTDMGMDRCAIETALTESQLEHTVSTTSLNVFENISSIGTPLDSRSCTSRDSQPVDDAMSKSLDVNEQPGIGISVVERNARVIRWLCNIRRVSTVTDDGEV